MELPIRRQQFLLEVLTFWVLSLVSKGKEALLLSSVGRKVKRRSPLTSVSAERPAQAHVADTQPPYDLETHLCRKLQCPLQCFITVLVYFFYSRVSDGLPASDSVKRFVYVLLLHYSSSLLWSSRYSDSL